MSRKTENIGFHCVHCGAKIKPLTNGSYRNHCPYCFYSLHMDNFPGDRASDGMGLMEPVGIRYHGKKGWQIIHRCQKCGTEKANCVATDTVQPDDWDAFIKLMQSEHHKLL